MFFYHVNQNSYSGGRIHGRKLWFGRTYGSIIGTKTAVTEFQAGRRGGAWFKLTIPFI
jgi:hypothetical protein